MILSNFFPVGFLTSVFFGFAIFSPLACRYVFLCSRHFCGHMLSVLYQGNCKGWWENRNGGRGHWKSLFFKSCSDDTLEFFPGWLPNIFFFWLCNFSPLACRYLFLCPVIFAETCWAFYTKEIAKNDGTIEMGGGGTPTLCYFLHARDFPVIGSSTYLTWRFLLYKKVHLASLFSIRFAFWQLSCRQDTNKKIQALVVSRARRCWLCLDLKGQRMVVKKEMRYAMTLWMPFNAIGLFKPNSFNRVVRRSILKHPWGPSSLIFNPLWIEALLPWGSANVFSPPITTNG